MPAKRLAFHQMDPVKMSLSKLRGLDFRDEVKAPEAGKYYRDKSYPDEVFLWHPSPKGSGENRPDPKHPDDRTKDKFHEHPKGHGEWHMGAVDVGGED